MTTLWNCRCTPIPKQVFWVWPGVRARSPRRPQASEASRGRPHLASASGRAPRVNLENAELEVLLRVRLEISEEVAQVAERLLQVLRRGGVGGEAAERALAALDPRQRRVEAPGGARQVVVERGVAGDLAERAVAAAHQRERAVERRGHRVERARHLHL